MIRRRTFLKTGLIGSFVLGGAYSIQKTFSFKEHPDFNFFDHEDVINMEKLSAAILKGTPLKKEQLPGLVKNIEGAVLGLSPMVQREVSELMLLFKLRPARWIFGRNETWSSASIEQIDELLKAFKHHRIPLFRAAYSALCELVNASYYADPKSWRTIGYPGPLELQE